MSNYATPAEAQAYFDNRLHTDPWDDANLSERNASLAMATEIIDRLNYKGSKTSDDQVNQFPRDADTLVPEDVKKASSEIALALLDGVDPDLEFENLSMTSQTYSGIKSNYDRSTSPEHTLAGVPSVTAWRYLKPYIRDPYSVDCYRV